MNTTLNINSLIDEFTPEQIKSAMFPIEGESPLKNALSIINMMNGYIVSNENIDSSVRETCSTIYCQLYFYLNLIDMAIGNEE